MQMYNERLAERRSDVRMPACVMVRVRVLGLYTPSMTKNISARGINISITTPCRFQPGEEYYLELSLPAEDSIIGLRASVLRVHRYAGSSGPQHVAFQFVEVSEQDEARIAKFIYSRQIQHKTVLKAAQTPSWLK